MRNLTPFFFLFLFCWSMTGRASGMPPSEMTHIDCPPTVACIGDGIVIEDYLPWADIIIPGVINCGNAAFTQMNYKFEATSPELSLRLTWETPEEDYLKMGVISGCIPDGVCIGDATCSTDEEMTLDLDNLIVGHEYVVYVDGCNNYEIDFELEITPGAAADFDAIVDISALGCEFGFKSGSSGLQSAQKDSHICPYQGIVIDFEFQDEDAQAYFNDAEAIWHFTVDGPQSFEFDYNHLNDIVFSVDLPGAYVVCLTSVDLTCVSYDLNICTEFEAIDNSVDYGVYEICEHDLNENNWVPDNEWLGDPISEQGNYNFEYFDNCGCYFTQSIEIIELKEEQAFLEIELCPDDYPYEFLDDFEFDYESDNIEEELVVYRGSEQKDYQNDRCDSLIYLTLINEDAGNRCSSCTLPISLEKSKIIYCIPFDNEAIDVSGKDNIVNAIGIDFDDNGSSNNVLWDALFDGDLDYVELPHSSDLNTSVFSINFQFVKDERFENGTVETLISKGDTNEDNLRYSINLEKVNESLFNLKGNFFGAANQYELGIDALQNNVWYDIVYVVGTDSISLYLNGYLENSVPIDENLRGNTDDLMLGTQFIDGVRSQFYNGRMNDFKYWKQKLSGQDVLFLHFPEKEFEVRQDYFLSCCEQTVIGDITIDKNNPLDTLVIPQASPTGYDSLYIYGFIQNDPKPAVDEAMVPEDVIVSYQQLCQEFCEAAVEWNVSPKEIFADNCNALTFSQSHTSPVVLDENVSFVEVTYTATDDCGQSNSFSFNLELECLPSEAEEIPEENVYRVEADDSCVDNETNAICKFSDIKLFPGYLDELSQDFQAYNADSNFDIVLSVNGANRQINVSDIDSGLEIPELKEEGTYNICIVSVSNECTTMASDFCATITIRSGITVDYGTIVACPENVEEVLPTEISEDFKTLIINNPVETQIYLTNEDDCGCDVQETIKLELASQGVPEEIVIETCPDMFPFSVLGVEIKEDEEYQQSEIRVENGSLSLDSNGNSCDSLILLTVIKNEDVEESISMEVCEGESYASYNTTGTYSDKFTAGNGCDSTRTLELTVLPKSYEDLFIEICPDSTYMGYSEEGTYEILGTNVLGCDSITTLNLTVLDESDPACMVSSLEQELLNDLSIYPNPVNSELNIGSDYLDKSNLRVSIVNMNGSIIMLNIGIEENINVSNLEQGLYMLKIAQGNEYLGALKFIKM